jgi:hypothetical protein
VIVYSGSLLAEDVEDAHPQQEHAHPHHEDETIEVNIFRMTAASPNTIVAQMDSEHNLQQSK